MVLNARDRQHMRLANEAAENCTRPRRWLAKYGALQSCTGIGSPEINKEYYQHRKRIADSVKLVKSPCAW